MPACLLSVTDDDGGTLQYTGGLATQRFSTWTSLVTRFILFMANDGGKRRAGQAQSGKRARLTQLRGIDSGGCLDDSEWKSTIVPSMNAVSEAHRSFKNPTLSWKTTTSCARGWQAGQHNCPAFPPPQAHHQYADSRSTNRMAGILAKPAKPLLLVSASSNADGSAPQRLVVHIP